MTVGKQRYFITANGKKKTNGWKSGYYLQADGTIARMKKVPDGSYVDINGRKCARREMKLSGLRDDLQQITGRYSGTWSVYVKDLKTGDIVNINECSLYPASVIKAFVMASTFQQIKDGKLSYSSYVQSLLRNMITVSDNEAYNQLVRCNSSNGSFVSGAAQVNKYLKKHGYTKTGCHHTLHPSSSASVGDGYRNISSAKDCGVLLEKIYKGTCVSKKYSQEMLNLLLRQERRWKIPAGLPAGTKVANKTGETSTTQNDMAIVYGRKTNYVISVFSSGVGEGTGIAGIKAISSYVYNYLN